MKKIRRLQVLVYIAFGLFFIQNGAADALQGFKEGVREGMGLKNSVVAPWRALKVLTH